MATKKAAKKTAKKAVKKATVKKATAKKATAKKAVKKATVKKAVKKAVAKKAAKVKVKRKPNAASTPMPRTEVTSKIWAYIKKNKLQDAVNRRMINADDKLKVLFGKAQASMFELTKYVSKHLS